MTTEASDLGVTLGSWNAMIRRARLTDRQKLAALLISSYADSKGRGIHCGAPRFAVDLGCSYSTARRYLAWMRDVGLIELVRAGSSKAKRADEYRLILGPRLSEHVDVLDPATYKALSQGIREANKTGVKVRRERAQIGSPDVHERSAMVSAHDGDVVRSSRVSAHGSMSAQTGLHERSPMDEPPPVTQHLPKEVDQPSNSADEDLRTDVAVEATPDKPRNASAKCSHRLSGATRADGRPACPLCRVEQDQAAGIRRPGTFRPPDPPPPPTRIAPVIDLHTREAQ